MRKSWIATGTMIGMMAGSAAGQVVPPAPAKKPPTPEYTPPPPPPPPAPVAPRDGDTDAKPAPETPLPSLIERDEAGKVKPLGMPAEEAAVRALELNEETMKKVEASLAGRRDDLDRLVIQNIEALVELKKFSAEVNDKTSLDEISKQAKKAQPFKSFVGVLDRLSREGAIDPQTRSRANRIASEYTKAAEAELLKEFDHGNTQAMVLMGFRRYHMATMGEAHAALDGMLAEAAPRMESLLSEVQMSAEMKAGVASRTRGLPKAGTPDADKRRAEALKVVFFEVLGPDQRGALLKAANPELFAEQPSAAEDGKPQK